LKEIQKTIKTNRRYKTKEQKKDKDVREKRFTCVLP
jgi:hypothetical protein